MDATTLLRAAPSLTDLGASLVARLADRCETLVLGAGQRLFRAGEESVGLYVVAEGQVRVTHGGGDQLLLIAVPGVLLVWLAFR